MKDEPTVHVDISCNQGGRVSLCIELCAAEPGAQSKEPAFIQLTVYWLKTNSATVGK